jgi:hypothetical protein
VPATLLVFPVVAYLGVVLLGFVRPPLLRALGRLLSIGLAAAATVLAVGLYRYGDENDWTGHGPGMLVVMLLIPAVGAVALATWGTVVAQWRAGRQRRVGAGLALGLIAVGLAGSAWSARTYQRTARPSHDAPVVAMAFRADGKELFSLDAGGTLKRWDVARRRMLEARREPALAGARSLFLSAEGRFAMALGPAGATLLRLDRAGPSTATLQGVERATLLPADRIAWVARAELWVAPLPAAAPATRVASFAVPITALTADAEGDLTLALADGRLLALGPDGESRRELASLPSPAVRLAVSAGGRWLAAGDAEGHAFLVDRHRDAVHPLARWNGLHHAAFVTDDVLIFTGAESDTAAGSLSLAGAKPKSGPWLGHGQIVTALAGAHEAPLAAAALGPELFLARAPRRAGDYVSDAERLVDPR